jgi:hypothetical protein
MLLALSEGWSDFVAITGLVVTVAGFAVTLYQLRKTQSAAEAARAAAERAFAESRQEFRRLIASSAHALATELRELAGRNQWDAAARRANDLADLLALLPGADAVVVQTVEELRVWGVHFTRLGTGGLRRFNNVKWVEFVPPVQRLIDRLRNPTPAPPGGVP